MLHLKEKKEVIVLPHIKKVLDSLLEEFKTGNIPEAIAIIKNPTIKIPCNAWSLMNMLLVYFHHTRDARGFRQWKEVKRHVKKGAKSFQILVPCFKKDEKEEKHLAYFTTANVFKVEDTDGEPLDYEKLVVPDLPLLDRAKEWGISVQAVGGNNSYFGFYNPAVKSIGLATPQENVFFHELAHVADEKNIGKLKRGQDPIQEIVAELSAQALCRIVGKDPSNTTGNSYQYIKKYAKELNLTPYTAVMQVLSRVDKALNLILKGGEDESVRLVNNGTTSL